MTRGRLHFLALLGIAGLFLASCATTQKFSAANDVHSLLVAIRDDDRAAFDAHIDKPALVAQFQAMMIQGTRGAGVPASVNGAALVLSGPLSRVAGKIFLRPDIFRAVAEYYGYAADTPIPGALSLTAALRSLPDGRVCATRRRNGPCLLTFAREGETWRLVAFDGDAAMLRLKGG
jgi:hypothetical protein